MVVIGADDSLLPLPVFQSLAAVLFRILGLREFHIPWTSPTQNMPGVQEAFRCGTCSKIVVKCGMAVGKVSNVIHRRESMLSNLATYPINITMCSDRIKLFCSPCTNLPSKEGLAPKGPSPRRLGLAQIQTTVHYIQACLEFLSACNPLIEEIEANIG